MILKKLHSALLLSLSILIFIPFYGCDNGSDNDDSISKPYALTAQIIADSQIQLVWECNMTNVDGFIVERSEDNGNYVQIAKISDEPYNDNDVSHSIRYSYRIKSYNGSTESGYSNVVLVTITPDPSDPPETPGNLTLADIGANSIMLNWYDNSSNESGFRVERSTESSFSNPESINIDANATNYRDGNLQPDTTYYYRILAYNNAGDSGFSNTAEGTTVQSGNGEVMINLTIKNNTGFARTNEPASYGVPFSVDDQITSLSNLSVTDSNGNSVDAQFDIITRYDGTVSDTSKPVRMMLCTFFADVQANSFSTYRVINGGNGNASGSDIVSESGDLVSINTGVLSIEINKNEGFRLFDKVEAGGSVLINSPTDDGIVVSSDSDVYKSNNSVPSKIEVEYNGPLKAVVAVHGVFKNASGSELKPQDGPFGMAYVTRIKAYRNKSYVHVQTTIKNENQGYVGNSMSGTHQNLHFDDLYLKTTLSGLAGQKQIQFDEVTDTNASGVYEVRQNHEENGQSEDNNFSYVITQNGSQRHTGNRYDSFSSLGDSANGLMIATRWFWQNWPKAVELNADNSVAKLCLWPEKSNDYLFPGAFWKTHEAIYYFHKNTDASYNFEKEIASLRNRLVLFADNAHTSDFLDYIPPADINSKTTFNNDPDQRLQPAIDIWTNNILAKFDFDQYGTHGMDFDQFRESRPYAWDSDILGVVDGVRLAGQYVNMYGWHDFGGMPRGGGGFSSQNYSWDFLALIHAYRTRNIKAFEVGEQLARSFGDALIIHSPIDSNGSWAVTSGGGYVENVHGGQRTEWDGRNQVYNWEQTHNANDPMYYDHSWPRGVMLQYLLSGDRYYLEVVDHIADNFLYNYSDYKPSHAAPNTDPRRLCNKGECYQDLVGSSRSFTRAIAAGVDLWKVTGETKFLNVAKGIFTNAVLAGELTVNGELAGIIEDSNNNAHMLYQGLAIKPMIHLYHALIVAGDNQTAEQVKNYLMREANWMNDYVYGQGYSAACGSTDGNRYFPYQTRTEWSLDQGSYGIDDPTYSFVYADLFAFAYRVTNDESWMNIARAIFNDYQIYNCDGAWEQIKTAGTSGGTGLMPHMTSYFKDAKTLTKPLYFLKTEWETNQ